MLRQKLDTNFVNMQVNAGTKCPVTGSHKGIFVANETEY